MRAAAGMALLAELSMMAAGVFALATCSDLLTGNTGQVPGLWLANGFAVAMLLSAPRERWPWLLLAATAGLVAATLHLERASWLSHWTSLLNLAEIFIAARTLPAAIRSAQDLTRRGHFLRFLAGAVLLAPAMHLALVTLGGVLLQRLPEPAAVQRMLASHMLGMAVMTPVTLALRNRELRAYLRPETLRESLLTLGVLALVSMGVFFQNGLPLLFLIFPPMMRVAWRGGFAGTAVAVLMVAVIGATATVMGRGPIAAMRDSGRLEELPLLGDGFVLLQIFIAALLLSMFPLIVALAEGRRAHRATAELQNRLRLLMQHASDVVLLTDLDGRRLYVSPAIREVTGVSPEDFLRMRWQDYVHEADREMIGAEIEESRRVRGARNMVFRTRHTDGRLVWLEASVKHFRDPAFVLMQAEREGDVMHNCGPHGDEGFVVTMRDISQRHTAELELERANAELAALIRTDSLTGLANRRRFDEVLEETWQRALADGMPLAVLMIDVDHFKQFNDAYGHQRGDLCLRDVAIAITTGLFHPDDLAARYGGEEFAVILLNTSTDNAARVAERIRRAVHELRRPHMAAPLGVVTVSIGVAAAHPVAHGSPLAVVRSADEALYLSKREGRNRTTLLDVTWPDPGR